MNKIIFKIIVFFIGSLTFYAQDLETVLKTDTIYIDINKGFSVYEHKSKKSVHLPCYEYYYYDSEVSNVLSFNTCKWPDETPPDKKTINSIFLTDKMIINLDFIKKTGFKIVARKFRGKISYVIKNLPCDKIEVTEAVFGSTYEGPVNDYKIIYEEKK